MSVLSERCCHALSGACQTTDVHSDRVLELLTAGHYRVADLDRDVARDCAAVLAGLEPRDDPEASEASLCHCLQIEYVDPSEIEERFNLHWSSAAAALVTPPRSGTFGYGSPPMRTAERSTL